MKKRNFILLCLSILFLLTACNSKEPIITIEANVTPLSDEEFRKNGDLQDMVNSKKEDFHRYDFTFRMEHTDDIKERNIEIMEDWPHLINSIDNKIRFNNGNSSSQDNESEDFASYHQEFTMYTKDLSETEIREAFRDADILVEWKYSKGKTLAKRYNISNNIKFNLLGKDK